MKSSLVQVLGLGAALLSLSPSFASACSTKSGVTITFYGFPDNDPPGAGTAYNCGGRNNIAGGSSHTYPRSLTNTQLNNHYRSGNIQQPSNLR